MGAFHSFEIGDYPMLLDKVVYQRLSNAFE